MDIICASICYRGYAEDEVEATFTNAPLLGYRLMEIHGPMTWSVDAVKVFDLPHIQARLNSSGLRCAGIYTPGWGGHSDEEVRQHAVAIAACADYAQVLGAHHITSSGASPRQEPGALGRVLACVQQVLERVQESNPIKLTLEPHYGNVLQQPEDFRTILDATTDERVGLCVDTGHFHSAGVDTVALIHEFGPRIHATHLKDHIGTVSVGIGRGEINLLAEIEALRQVGYTGDLTVELEVNDPQNLPRYTQEAYLYLCGMLGKHL
jgi:sugar phosphate isomerase/epimerase